MDQIEAVRVLLRSIVETSRDFDGRSDIDRLRSLLCDVTFDAKQALKLLDPAEEVPARRAA